MSAPSIYPDLYRSIVYDAVVSPGTVTLSGHNRDLSWDTVEAKGQTGASSTLNGSSVGQFQAEFYLATVADQIAWSAFQRVLESSVSGPTPVAKSIYHPDLAANHFTSACVSSIGGIVRSDNGGCIVQVKFIEYRPPKPAPAKTAKGGGKKRSSGNGGASKPDPNAARKAEVDALLNEARSP